MKASADFSVHATDLLGTLGRVVVRRMFGVHGVYCDGVMFALIADDVLYLKTDESSASISNASARRRSSTKRMAAGAPMAHQPAPDETMESCERDGAVDKQRARLAALRARSTATAKESGAACGSRAGSKR